MVNRISEATTVPIIPNTPNRLRTSPVGLCTLITMMPLTHKGVKTQEKAHNRIFSK